MTAQALGYLKKERLRWLHLCVCKKTNGRGGNDRSVSDATGRMLRKERVCTCHFYCVGDYVFDFHSLLSRTAKPCAFHVCNDLCANEDILASISCQEVFKPLFA